MLQRRGDFTHTQMTGRVARAAAAQEGTSCSWDMTPYNFGGVVSGLEARRMGGANVSGYSASRGAYSLCAFFFLWIAFVV